MPEMITEIETYFSDGCGRCARFGTPECSVQIWSAALVELRRICLSLGLQETVKWGQPCYMHADRNIVIIGAFRKDVRLTFFNGSLLKDPEGLLEKRGPNTQQADILSFQSAQDVRAKEAVIRGFVQALIGYAAAGIRPEKKQIALTLPVELADALDANAALAEAFHSLTPGRQRSYVIALASAKTSATRRARVAKYREKIIAGKGANERT